MSDFKLIPNKTFISKINSNLNAFKELDWNNFQNDEQNKVLPYKMLYVFLKNKKH